MITRKQDAQMAIEDALGYCVHSAYKRIIEKLYKSCLKLYGGCVYEEGIKIDATPFSKFPKSILDCILKLTIRAHLVFPINIVCYGGVPYEIKECQFVQVTLRAQDTCRARCREFN